MTNQDDTPAEAISTLLAYFDREMARIDALNDPFAAITELTELERQADEIRYRLASMWPGDIAALMLSGRYQEAIAAVVASGRGMLESLPSYPAV